MSQFALSLSPVDNNYSTSLIRYNQLTENPDVVTVNGSNFTAGGTTPTVRTFGDGEVMLSGSVVAAGTPTTNYPIGTLPNWCVPLQDSVYPVTVLRAGAAVFNAVKINVGGDSITSVTVTTPGSYATLPTVSISGPGTGAVLALSMKAVSATLAAAGTGYAPADTITATGGTETTNAVFTVASTKLITAAVNAAGTGYAPANILTMVGGTASTAAQLTVATTKVVSASVAAGGTGGTPGTQTVTGTTGTGTKFQASVTVSGGGAITAVLSITVAGSYTVNPTTISAEPVTGAGLTGATLAVVMGIASVTTSLAGVYTANSATFTSTGGTGTGATFNTATYGVNAVTVSTAGSYTALPASPVAQGATSGSGTGATLTILWGLLAIGVTSGGSGYNKTDRIVISGGGGTGGGAATLVFDSSVGIQLVNAATVGDIVFLDGISFPVESYVSQ